MLPDWRGHMANKDALFHVWYHDMSCQKCSSSYHESELLGVETVALRPIIFNLRNLFSYTLLPIWIIPMMHLHYFPSDTRVHLTLYSMMIWFLSTSVLIFKTGHMKSKFDHLRFGKHLGKLGFSICHPYRHLFECVLYRCKCNAVWELKILELELISSRHTYKTLILYWETSYVIVP